MIDFINTPFEIYNFGCYAFSLFRRRKSNGGDLLFSGEPIAICFGMNNEATLAVVAHNSIGC